MTLRPSLHLGSADRSWLLIRVSSVFCFQIDGSYFRKRTNFRLNFEKDLLVSGFSPFLHATKSYQIRTKMTTSAEIKRITSETWLYKIWKNQVYERLLSLQAH